MIFLTQLFASLKPFFQVIHYCRFSGEKNYGHRNNTTKCLIQADREIEDI